MERAAYLLRKVFDFEYAELSSILDKSVDNCRADRRAGRERGFSRGGRGSPPLFRGRV